MKTSIEEKVDECAEMITKKMDSDEGFIIIGLDKKIQRQDHHLIGN